MNLSSYDDRGTCTNSQPTYSSFKTYGSNGAFNPIIPPYPATVEPKLFEAVTPHAYSVNGNGTGMRAMRNVDTTMRPNPTMRPIPKPTMSRPAGPPKPHPQMHSIDFNQTSYNTLGGLCKTQPLFPYNI